MRKEDTLAETVRLCKEFGFCEEITHEQIWNTAYRLGRSRWYWGPHWWVDVIGRINTVRGQIRDFICH